MLIPIKMNENTIVDLSSASEVTRFFDEKDKKFKIKLIFKKGDYSVFNYETSIAMDKVFVEIENKLFQSISTGLPKWAKEEAQKRRERGYD